MLAKVSGQKTSVVVSRIVCNQLLAFEAHSTDMEASFPRILTLVVSFVLARSLPCTGLLPQRSVAPCPLPRRLLLSVRSLSFSGANHHTAFE